jgi:hypothetical protein
LGDKKKFLGRKAIKKPQSGKLGLDEFLTSDAITDKRTNNVDAN